MGEAIVGRYEGAWENGKCHGHGTFTYADGDRCARHGRGVPGVSRGGARMPSGRERGALGACGRTCLTQRCAGGGRTRGVRVVVCGWVVVGEAIVGRYVGEFSIDNDEFHGQGTFTAAKAGWCFTGALAHNRPTQGELTEADGRRFAVQYAADCPFIQHCPTPSSKVRVGSMAPRSRTSMVLQRRRRASAALLVPACAGVCRCMRVPSDGAQATSDDLAVPQTLLASGGAGASGVITYTNQHKTSPGAPGLGCRV